MSLTPFGILQPGESAILTDNTVAAFQADWNLDPSVPVIGGNSENLGRSDEINLYDSTNTLIDRLTYNDQGTGDVKGPRTNSTAAYILPANYGANNASLAVAASVGDSNGSRTATLGEVGNPGPVAMPEPASLGLLAIAGLFIKRNRAPKRRIETCGWRHAGGQAARSPVVCVDLMREGDFHGKSTETVCAHRVRDFDFSGRSFGCPSVSNSCRFEVDSV